MARKSIAEPRVSSFGTEFLNLNVLVSLLKTFAVPWYGKRLGIAKIARAKATAPMGRLQPVSMTYDAILRAKMIIAYLIRKTHLQVVEDTMPPPMSGPSPSDRTAGMPIYAAN